MHADVKGCLNALKDGRNKFWRAFEHKGERMSREEVVSVLKYAESKGYETTKELSDSEVDEILQKMKK